MLKAAQWMAATVTMMLLMAVSGRMITREINVFQAMEMRSILAFVMLLPLVHREGGFKAMKTKVLGMHVGRNAVHYLGQYSWLLGLTMIPLAQVISIEFTAPIWTAFLAAMFLGERLTWRKGIVALFGFIGVAIIVRPGAVPLNPGHLIVLGAAIAFAIVFVITKSLSRTESATKVLFWMLVVQSIIGAIPAFRVWVWPSLSTWPWIVVFAFTGAFAHFCMAKAVSYADASVVMPMDYLRVPLSALLGYLIFSEGVDIYTATGAALIIAGNLFNLRQPEA